MEQSVDFGSLLSGLQCMPERDKIIFSALMERQLRLKTPEAAKVERLLGRMTIDAARGVGADSAKPDAGLPAARCAPTETVEETASAPAIGLVAEPERFGHGGYPPFRSRFRLVFKPLVQGLAGCSLVHTHRVRQA
ncbi:MAG: hypothetical protein M0T84_04380 [Betaproteobacteria bacterium]|nr:hypothetical protein [Betaproteobacteria bacterium]